MNDELNVIHGCSVTGRIKQIKQPYGGYVPVKDMDVTVLGNDIDELDSVESISPSTVGSVVDYLVRFMSGTPVEEAFHVGLMGARMIKELDRACALLSRINGLEDTSICSAIMLARYDACIRAGIDFYQPISLSDISQSTISNIRIMVERSLNFFKQYGKKVLDGFTFEGGYTDIVISGDGDFITSDTLWDFKVSKNKPNKNHTLQLLMYWRMGLHSKHPEFKNIQYLGIFNPRSNTVYRIPVEKISSDVIKTVERDVIGY